MKTKEKFNISLDKFIDLALYDKNFGYYMKKNPFGKKGDFTTAPNISRLFSETIAIWIISFWKSIGSPSNFNLIELGAGNGEMMKDILESFEKFPSFLQSSNIFIYEKSPGLIKIQKKKLKKSKIIWLSNLNNLKKIPSMFIANEFFDSISIKQFIRINKKWHERFVNIQNKNNAFFFDKEIDMKNYEKKIKLNISKNQNFIEFSEIGAEYLTIISNFVKKNRGGLLIIDYGYFDKKMKNTLQAISNKNFSHVLKNVGNSDITHLINFNLFNNIVNKIGELNSITTTQGSFLTKMGINQRAEIVSNNLTFLKKADLYYRLKRLIDDKQMGALFKVMLIKNKKNKFNLGF